MQGKKRILAFVLLSVAAFSFLGMSVMREPLATVEMPSETSATAKSGVCNLLILGKDNTADLCDVLILASFDLESGHLHMLQIPRDTYFAYTREGYKKINAASRVLGGTDKFKAALSDALGIRIDGYIEFDLAFVESAVDMIGGVELNVPCDMDYDDPAQELSIHLKKGMQTLMGKDAVGFVRFRSGYVRADLGRMDAQKLFLASFAKAFAKNVSVGELPRVLFLAMKHVKTDLRLDTMVSLATGVRKLPNEEITVLTLPGEEVQSEYSGAWYYILSHDGCAEVIDQYFGETTARGFDANGLFTDRSRKSFDEIYQRKISAVPYTFEGLMSEGVVID